MEFLALENKKKIKNTIITLEFVEADIILKREARKNIVLLTEPMQGVRWLVIRLVLQNWTNQLESNLKDNATGV